MMTICIFGVFAVLVLLVLILWARHDVRVTLQRFQQSFPGRCPICTYHRFGLMHGYERRPLPKTHFCTEKASAGG